MKLDAQVEILGVASVWAAYLNLQRWAQVLQGLSGDEVSQLDMLVPHYMGLDLLSLADQGYCEAPERQNMYTKF
jgi:hypothetical protein